MILFISVIVIFVLLYIYGTRNFNYWKERGIKYERPIPFLGNAFKQLFFRVTFTNFFVFFYKRYPNERFVGLYQANNPTLIIREPRDVQRVLITDFHCFYGRGVALREPEPAINKHLFSIDGDLWRLLRHRMTPAFTTGKLKAMFPLIVDRAQKLQKLAAEAATRNKETDVKDLMARYTTDFIGACGFGIDMEALNDKNSVFRRLGTNIFKIRVSDIIRRTLKTLMPTIFYHLPSIHPEVEEMATSLIFGVMKERNYEPSGRNDFVDLLLAAKKQGKMVGDSFTKKNPDGTPATIELELGDMLIAAQVFLFFAAGFETSSSTSSFTLHLLAFHPDEQRKCQDEIDEVLQKYDGKLCYEAINEMEYLKMCFYESMRINPSVGVLFRKAASKYTFPDSNLTIDKGVLVAIVNQGMQMDEKYFKDPEKFIPERFSPENAKDMKKHVFLPFGEGPRACIGERLGLMQALAGLAAILSKFSVAPSENTLRKPVGDPRGGLVQTIKGGLPLLLVERKKTN